MNKKPDGKYSESAKFGRVWLGKMRSSGVWYIRCHVPNSTKVIFRSTGVTQKTAALKEAILLDSQLLNKKYGVADGSVPIATLFEKFIEAKGGRVKTKTLERLKTTISSFRQWLNIQHPDCRLARNLTPDIIRRFQLYRKDGGLSLRSVNNDIMNLHTVFSWAVRECLIDKSPADYSKNGSIDRFKAPHSIPDVYTDSEVDALIKAADSSGDTLTSDLVTTFAGTGMRFEELAHLKPSYIVWSLPPKIEIRARNGWSPKDLFEVKLIPMLPEVEKIIRRRCSECGSEDEYIFKNTVGGKVHVNRSRERLQKLFSVVGTLKGRRLHWHSFRNYFIIRCLKRSLMPSAIMQWTGHDSEAMVMHYARAMKVADGDKEFSKLF